MLGGSMKYGFGQGASCSELQAGLFLFSACDAGIPQQPSRPF
jgi:hypothetical protein